MPPLPLPETTHNSIVALRGDRATMKLLRETEHLSGLVTIRRIVEANGSFAPTACYIASDRTHVWRRARGETLEGFEERVLEEATWLAARRSRPVMLIPIE